MIDATTHSLFFYYPRAAHIPQIYTLKNERDFDNYVQTHNGTPRGCHVSLYDITQRPVIDKVLFEFDGNKAKLHLVFEEVKDLVSQFRKKKLPFIPVFSGTKGFHIYLLLKPLEMDAEIAKAIIRQIQYKFAAEADKLVYKYLDRHKVGVVRTQIRVPNTLNKSLFCTYLPSYFDELTMREILELASEPRHYSYDFELKKSALDLVEYHREIDTFSHTELPVIKAPAAPRLQDLIDVIRPCVYRAVTRNPEPPHMIRVNFVSELMWLGHTPEQIYELCKQIRWRDFDEHKTKYQINHIFKNRLLPHSCRRLKEIVKCSNCGWIYDWGGVCEGNHSDGVSHKELNGHSSVGQD